MYIEVENMGAKLPNNTKFRDQTGTIIRVHSAIWLFEFYVFHGKISYLSDQEFHHALHSYKPKAVSSQRSE